MTRLGKGILYESRVAESKHSTLRKIVSIEGKPEKYEVDTAGDRPHGEVGEGSD